MTTHEYLAGTALIAAVMAASALLETVAPLRARPAAFSGRRRANLAMTAQVLAFTFVLTTLVPLVPPPPSAGLLAASGLPFGARLLFGVLLLDFAYGYVAHRTLHAWPALWRYHRVHHSDPFVDATTSYRTHPVEIVWRHLWLFGAAWTADMPGSVVVTFRLASAVNGILEHANVRIRPALDAVVAWVWVTPNTHKIHHSRVQTETDANYGNLFTLHDRLFGTFVPSARAAEIGYGLDDVAPAEVASVWSLLALPWRRARLASAAFERAA